MPNDFDFVLHLRFEEQAKKTPGAIALFGHGESITFAELSVASDRVAAALRSRSICDRASVGLYLERSIQFVIALLGILKSNNAAVPLPPSYPEGRLREILSYSRLDAVIDDSDTRLDPSLCERIFHLPDLRVHAAGAGDDGRSSSNQSAFVLCSSGSTGQPKMIVRSHRSFFHRLNWTWDNWPYADDEVCCQKSHMTTTHAAYELFEPMLRGVPVHIVADETVRNLELFWETIRATGVTRLLIVPSVLQASLDMPEFVAPPIRIVVLMGEYLHPRLAGRAIEAFPPQTKIFSIYGSTEASSTLVCDVKESYREGEDLPLGKPIALDVRALVLNPALEEVGAGESGLLHIAGPALFSGYFRNPALTESSFVKAPKVEGELFNTQDQVRMLGDGSLQYVGRVDHTVKVRGFRVDLGEVERTMLLQPQVSQAVVMLGGVASENPPLVAFYTPSSVDRPALYEALRDRLPVYMVPSILTGMDSLPLTASGKIDRKRLLEDYARRAPLAAAGEPLSETEARVVGIWQRVLNHHDIPRDSSFFEIGGTSLSVFTAVHHLRNEFRLDRDQLSDHSMYQFPSAKQLANYIDGLKHGGEPTSRAKTAVAVTLRNGDSALAPLFVIASSGGTLGAYEKMVKALKTGRAIVGIRDPYVWGERNPTLGFQDWIATYLAAIQERQPAGPYYVCAYSSAGAFGYEIAQRLRQGGHEVAVLVLIDPIGIAGEVTDDFGYKTFTAIFNGRRRKLQVRLAGWLRRMSGAGRKDSVIAGDNDFTMTWEEIERRVAVTRRDKGAMKDLSSLLELNSGLPFAMTDDDFSGKEPDQFLATLLAKVKAVSPEIEPDTIERILIQYYCLQLPATHFYRLKNYDGMVEIFEPEGSHVGLLAAYFHAYVRNLRVYTLKLGQPSERIQRVCANLGRSFRNHYRCMRDDAFVASLAAKIDALLEKEVKLSPAAPTSSIAGAR